MGQYQIEADATSAALPAMPTGNSVVLPTKATLFFGALAVVTILPMVLLPLSGGTIPDQLNTLMLGVWIVAGFSHVMSTTWFGLDKDYQGLINAHRFRMIGSFALVPMLLAILVLASSFLAGWVFMAYWIWQSHHYNRQNYGIMSFASAHDGMGPLPPQVNWILHLTTAAGAIVMGSMPSIYGPGLEAPWLLTALDLTSWRILEALLLLAATGLALQVVATNVALRRSPTVLIFFALSVVFYVPGLLFPSSNLTGFWPYAIAHGSQYLIIMGVTARGSSRGLVGLIIFGLLAGVLGVAAYLMNGVPWTAFYSGIVVWHFLADARLWRLRDPAVRSIVRGRFDFIFQPKSRSSVAALR